MTDIAFFTTGDLATETIPDSHHGDRHPRVSIALPSGPTLTNDIPTTSQLWEARAMALATRGHVHGVRTTADARGVLDALPRESVRNVFFVGHGLPGMYAFSGRREGPHGTSGTFLAQPANILQAPSSETDDHAKFFASLAARLSRNENDHVHIIFMSCFTGREPATGPKARLEIALAAKLQREGLRNFTVGCYVDFYAVRPVVSTNTHHILHFLDRVVFEGTATPVPGHDSPGAGRLPRPQKIIGQIPSAEVPIG